MTASYHAPSLRSAAGHRLLTLLALSSLVLGLVGCGPPREPDHPLEEPPEPVEPSVPQVSALLTAASALPLVHDSVETTEHFGEPLVGELRLTPGALDAYVQGHPLPPGTQIALVVRSPGGASDEPVRVLWMEKRSAGWHFDADPGDGTPVDGDRLCSRCHAEAPSDSVFRIRLPAWKEVDGSGVEGAAEPVNDGPANE